MGARPRIGNVGYEREMRIPLTTPVVPTKCACTELYAVSQIGGTSCTNYLPTLDLQAMLQEPSMAEGSRHQMHMLSCYLNT